MRTATVLRVARSWRFAMGRARWSVLAFVLGCEVFVDPATPSDSIDGAPTATCGNGQLDPGELCDPAIPSGAGGACPTDCDRGNTCYSDALIQPGTCLATCVHEAVPNCCGNGIVEAGEACDDGNQRDYD